MLVFLDLLLAELQRAHLEVSVEDHLLEDSLLESSVEKTADPTPTRSKTQDRKRPFPNYMLVGNLRGEDWAGKTCDQNNQETDYQKRVNKERRTYTQKDEQDRSRKLSNIEIKDHSFFAGSDSIWNETSRLQPSVAKYSADMPTFKKHVVDLNQVKKDELDGQFQDQFKKLLKNKTDANNRMEKRKMERLIN